MIKKNFYTFNRTKEREMVVFGNEKYIWMSFYKPLQVTR